MPSGSLKLSKAESGRLGGLVTVSKNPTITAEGKNQYMQSLGIKGAAAFHAKYRLSPLGLSDFAIVERATGTPTGKTIRGLRL